MVVLADGKTVGTIGGGCVEAEVRVRALQRLTSGGDKLFTFNLDHDHGWDDGLVCGGTMDVAVQIISSAKHADTFRTARDRLVAGESAELIIAVPDDHEQTVSFTCSLHPSPTLVIAGGGHVGAALAAVAHQMEFSITVIDDRPDFASVERFPMATRLIGAVETQLAKLQFNQQTYVVIVTRGHRRDALALAAVVRSDARYIGLIGSKRKIVKIFQDLQAQGVSADQLSRVHAPVGLDIGAVTPAEIAVSIAAQLVAARRGLVNQPALPMRLTPAQIARL